MMSAAVAPSGTYRFDKAERGSNSMADELGENEKFSPEVEDLLAEDHKKIFIVIYTDRCGKSRSSFITAPSRTDAETKFSKTKGQPMVTFGESKAELRVITERKQRMAQLEKNPDAEVRYPSFPPPNDFPRLSRLAEILVLTEEEFELRQAS